MKLTIEPIVATDYASCSNVSSEDRFSLFVPVQVIDMERPSLLTRVIPVIQDELFPLLRRHDISPARSVDLPIERFRGQKLNFASF